jgi:hypothetical protein
MNTISLGLGFIKSGLPDFVLPIDDC